MQSHSYMMQRLDREAPSNYSRKERILDPLSYLHNVQALPPLPGHAYSWDVQEEIKKSLTLTEEVREQGGVQDDVKEFLQGSEKDLLIELLAGDVGDDKGPREDIPDIPDIPDITTKNKKKKSKSSIEISQSPGATQIVYFPVLHDQDAEKIPASVKNVARTCGKSLGKDKKKIGPGQYSAIEVHGFYGFIDVLGDSQGDSCGKGYEKVLIVHTPSRVQDKSPMLNIRPGDTIDIVYIPSLTRGKLEVTFVTRSKYFSPGCPVTSLQVGVLGWEYK